MPPATMASSPRPSAHGRRRRKAGMTAGEQRLHVNEPPGIQIQPPLIFLEQRSARRW
jgi:hypothetical protein